MFWWERGSEGWGGFRSSRDNDALMSCTRDMSVFTSQGSCLPAGQCSCCFGLGKAAAAEVTPCCLSSWSNADYCRDFPRSGSVKQCADADKQFGKCFHLYSGEEQCSPEDVRVVQDQELVLGLAVSPCSWFGFLCIPYLINSVAAQGTQEMLTGIPTPDNNMIRWRLNE